MKYEVYKQSVDEYRAHHRYNNVRIVGEPDSVGMKDCEIPITGTNSLDNLTEKASESLWKRARTLNRKAIVLGAEYFHRSASVNPPIIEQQAQQ